MKNILHSPFFRLLSIALVSAILCSFSFFFFSASAETSNSGALDLSGFQSGMLGDYPVISDIYNLDLIKSYLSTSSSNSSEFWDSYLIFTVYNNKIYFAQALSNIGYHYSTFSGKLAICFSFGGSVTFNPITAPIDFSDSSYAYDFRNYSYSTSGTTFTFLNSYYSSDRYTYSPKFLAADGTALSPNGDYTFYFARVSSSKSPITFSSISSNLSSLRYTDFTYSARFLHLTTAEDDPRIKLNFIDHIVAGKQYPTFDLQINDNGMHYSYSVRVGVNTQYASKIEEFWLNEDSKQQFSSNSFGLFIPNNASTFVQTFKYCAFLTQCDTWSYDYSTSISSDLFSFSSSDAASRILSLNLSDYISVMQYNIYKLEIVCNDTSQVLSTTFFTSPRSYSRSDSGYGVKSYDYSSSSDADADSSSGNYTGNYTQGLTGSSSNPNDIVSNAFKDTVSSINITDLSSSFQSSITNVSAFFQACWTLFPPALWSIILTGLGLIVILRILGR